MGFKIGSGIQRFCIFVSSSILSLVVRRSVGPSTGRYDDDGST